MNYIIITSAFNEAFNIERTIQSVLKQSILPVFWYIVNDGSTDDTENLIKKYSAEHSFIKLLNKEKTTVEFGAHVATNFNFALSKNEYNDWEFIVKLDADLDIDREDFFEYQIQKFKENEKLGLCSGITYSIINGQKKLTKGRPYWRTGGAMKIYRKKCFNDIGGIAPIYGWDGLDEYLAMYNGWKTRTFFELHVNHLGKVRALNREKQSNLFYKRGISFYQRGYPVEFILTKAIKIFKTDSFMLAKQFIKGYFHSKKSKTKRYVTNDQMKFYRKLQYIRFIDKFSKKELL